MKNLTFVLAPDSFKDSMTAQKVCGAVSLEDAMSRGKENIERTVENIVRILLLK